MDELNAQDEADPFVDAPEEQRRQADFLHAVFLLRRLKDQISSHAPLIAMANALQVAMRSSGLLTSVRSSSSIMWSIQTKSKTRHSVWRREISSPVDRKSTRMNFSQ